MTFKRYDQVYIIDAVTITEKGYIVEFSETFLAKKELYSLLLDYLNHIVGQDLDTVHKKLRNKKNLRDALDYNN